jgi:hypothetical protein
MEEENGERKYKEGNEGKEGGIWEKETNKHRIGEGRKEGKEEMK